MLIHGILIAAMVFIINMAIPIKFKIKLVGTKFWRGMPILVIAITAELLILLRLINGYTYFTGSLIMISMGMVNMNIFIPILLPELQSFVVTDNKRFKLLYTIYFIVSYSIIGLLLSLL